MQGLFGMFMLHIFRVFLAQNGSLVPFKGNKFTLLLYLTEICAFSCYFLPFN